ncbi:MAG: NAD(P)/FAD-dependent oxidoreductase [Candidatus Latescibacterota bacterium]
MDAALVSGNGRRPRVVVAGGGFGGLYAVRALRRAPAQVTVVDRRNFHLFQPLLYQVATGGLSPGDIGHPLRSVFRDYPQVTVLVGEVVDLDPEGRRVILRRGELEYDYLVVAAGATHHYFGHDEWARWAQGLKTVEDALEVRRRVLLAFEAAEREVESQRQRAWLRFVVIGGGPTGVELCGALAELARGTLAGEFRRIDPRTAEVILVEHAPRLLPPYPPALSAAAEKALRRLGVEVQTGVQVVGVSGRGVVLGRGDQREEVEARTVLWAAGTRPSELAAIVGRRYGAELNRGRVVVQPDLSLPNHRQVFVIGDMASFAHQGGGPLPAVAPVAIQQGRYVGRLITRRLRGQATRPFRYRGRGNLAVIGRNAAVADLGRVRLAGWPAWLAWIFVHIAYLIGFDNKVLVLFQWAWNWATRKRGARLITGPEVIPPLVPAAQPGAGEAQDPAAGACEGRRGSGPDGGPR